MLHPRLRTFLFAAALPACLAACDGPTDPGPDESPPTIVEVGPDGAVLTEPGATLLIEGRVEDDREVAAVDYRFLSWKDGVHQEIAGTATLLGSGSDVRFEVPFTPQHEGRHSAVFTARDAAGNQTAPGHDTAIHLLVDWTDPEVAILDPAPELTEWPSAVVSVMTAGRDATSIEKIGYSVDGAPFIFVETPARATLDVPIHMGANTITVRAVDAAGRTADTSRVVTRVAPYESRFTAIEGTAENWCGLAPDGTWLCRGENVYGVLGTGAQTPLDVLLPVMYDGALGDLGFGPYHGCALTADGTPYCWGGGYLGERAAANESPVPSPASDVLTMTSLRVGWGVTCGVATDGAGWCWGLNEDGLLGGGDTPVPGTCGYYDLSCSSTPIRVAAPVSFRTIQPGFGTACGLTPSGEAWCWGSDVFGAIGDGAAGSGGAHPARVAGGLTFGSLDLDGGAACGVTTGGDAYCWGSNVYGQIGDGTKTNRYVPTAVATSRSWTSIGFADDYLACGLATDGTVHCWGDGSTELTPLPGGLVFTQVSRSHGCGIATDGGAYCWDASLDPVRVGDAT